jgi:choline dehydrogenase-like flavoprotein
MKRAVVVGSGAGGATAARALQGAFDVTVLEAGHEFRPLGRDLARLEQLRASRLFLDERMITALFPPMRVVKDSEGMALVYGIGTGGTTTMAAGNGVRADEALQETGIDLGAEFAALDAVLPISAEHRPLWRPATEGLFAACAGLGLEPWVTPKLVDYRRCTRCGRCVLGCPRGAKWDSRVFLREAEAAGARLETGVRVDRVVVDGGRAAGLSVWRHGRRDYVPADVVVLAAGGLGTPPILQRSGIATQNRLFVDPVLCVAAPWPGARLNAEIPMPFVVERKGYIVSPYFDFLSFFFDRRWLRPAGDVIALMIKLADSEVGVAGPGRAGSPRPRVRKGLTARDRRQLREAVELCTQVLTAAGVRRADIFLGACNAGHPGGMLPLDGQERRDMQADHLPDGLYVADATLLPKSLGKPPILTVMALATRVARRCAERHA